MSKLSMSKVDRILARMSRRFMQPTWGRETVYQVETNIGTETVPEDACGRLATDADGNVMPEDLSHLHDYCEGKPESAERCTGWTAQLSAPGYMDQTDLTLHDSEDDAKRYLVEMYGEDDGGE